MHRFFRLTLRTLDADAARAFYAAVLGAAADRLDIVVLHAQAVARGARPHWLGFVEVPDVDAAAAALLARGATAYGKWVNPQGLEAAVLRDGGGAILAVARYRDAGPTAPSNDTVDSVDPVACILHTADLDGAKATYRDVFGWEVEAPVALAEGLLFPFAWSGGTTAAPTGGVIGTAGRPGVHPHWLFFFPTADLAAAVAAVRASGGSVVGPTTLPTGEAVAVCDDAQGAAFGLWAAPPR